MASTTPIIRQIAWLSIIPQMIVMGLLMLLWYQFNQQDFLVYGAVTYWIISFILRSLIPKNHRSGMNKVKVGNYESAIADFEKSYDFFDKNQWIDKYKFLLLLSYSKISYKEMALNNIAFCYGQIGEGDKSKAFYERTLKEYPESGIAKAGLNLINAKHQNN